MPRRSDDPTTYKRQPVSNYEGFKRLDKSLEKIDAKEDGRAKVCDLCHKRCRAWRIVPATFGQPLGRTRAAKTGGLQGKFVVACDAGPESCASMLTRSGVAKQGVEEQEAVARLAKLGIVRPS